MSSLFTKTTDSATINGRIPQQTISPDSIRAQLAAILAASEFKKSKKLGDFLAFIVEKTLDGHSKQIKQYTVAIDALGHNLNFDPQTNPIVRITAMRLRQTLTRYYETEGAQDEILIIIPKGSYVPEFRVNDSVGIDRRSPINKDQDIRSLSLANSIGPTIVVLSFAYQIENQDLHYLATGLTEQLVVTFNRFPEYLIIGPLLLRAENDEYGDLRAVGQAYQAQFVLSGNLRQQGNLFRLTVKLTDALTGGVVWAESYDNNGNLVDLFSFEDEVVNRITAVLGDNLGVIARSLTPKAMNRKVEDTAVYDAILRYYHYVTVFSEKSYIATLEALEYAVQQNPTYPLTLAMLADMYHLEYQLMATGDAKLEQVIQLTQRCLTLDPQCQHGRLSEALIRFTQGNGPGFVQKLEHALLLNPNNANALYTASVYLSICGEGERAKVWLNKAMHLNPKFPSYVHLISYLEAYHHGNYAEALIAAKQLNLPDLYLDPLIRAAVLGQLGEVDEGETAVSQLLALQPDFAKEGRKRMYRLFFSNKNVQALADGLAKVGLQIN